LKSTRAFGIISDQQLICVPLLSPAARAGGMNLVAVNEAEYAGLGILGIGLSRWINLSGT